MGAYQRLSMNAVHGVLVVLDLSPGPSWTALLFVKPSRHCSIYLRWLVATCLKQSASRKRRETRIPVENMAEALKTMGDCYNTVKMCIRRAKRLPPSQLQAQGIH